MYTRHDEHNVHQYSICHLLAQCHLATDCLETRSEVIFLVRVLVMMFEIKVCGGKERSILLC
jgi:hypothetical protein